MNPIKLQRDSVGSTSRVHYYHKSNHGIRTPWPLRAMGFADTVDGALKALTERCEGHARIRALPTTWSTTNMIRQDTNDANSCNGARAKTVLTDTIDSYEPQIVEKQQCRLIRTNFRP